MSHIFTFTLPDIGEGVVEGEIIEWLKQVGEEVKKDEPVVIVMTDKATVELPAPYPGKILKHYYQVGEKAYKDKPLYDMGVEEEMKEKKEVMTSPSFSSSKNQPLPSISDTKVLATPIVRRLAKERGIDIQRLQGTGKEGRVTEEDVLAVSRHSTPLLRLEGDESIPLQGIPLLMAKRVTESKQLIPHFSFFDQLDATYLIQLRHHLKEKVAEEDIHLTYMPFFIRALSLTIKKYPLINASIDLTKNVIVIHHQQNIGIAMNSKNGLIVPILKEVENLKLPEIVHQFETLKEKALHSKLESSDMQEGTMTMSNFGTLGRGGLFATPIINYPQVAILATAKIKPQVVAKEGKMVIREILNLSWSFDHRIVDGHLAAEVSSYYSGLLENPAQLT